MRSTPAIAPTTIPAIAPPDNPLDLDWVSLLLLLLLLLVGDAEEASVVVIEITEAELDGESVTVETKVITPADDGLESVLEEVVPVFLVDADAVEEEDVDEGVVDEVDDDDVVEVEDDEVAVDEVDEVFEEGDDDEPAACV